MPSCAGCDGRRCGGLATPRATDAASSRSSSTRLATPKTVPLPRSSRSTAVRTAGTRRSFCSALYQALAAAGYVVVLPNPRGSQGYGEEFAGECVGDWGGADFEDLMGAVDHLVHTGVADPERLVRRRLLLRRVHGELGRRAHEPLCRRVRGGPGHRPRQHVGNHRRPEFSSEHELGGLPWERREDFAGHSPVTYLGDVTTPVQLFHWEGDLRCPIGQTEEFFQALRKLRP